MADNRAANLLLICAKCGRHYRAIAAQVGRRCICGGVLEPEPKKEPPAHG